MTTVGLFLGTRGAIHSPRRQRRLSRRPQVRPEPPGRLGTLLARPKAAGARLGEVLDRSGQATGVLLVSAVTGFPRCWPPASTSAAQPCARRSSRLPACWAGRFAS